MSGAFVGDVSPSEAWEILEAAPSASLVDVRTEAEWRFVGLADLSKLGREAQLLSWQDYPTMEIDSGFQAKLERMVTDKSAPVLFLCRSGARSKAAAMAAAAAGYAKAYNIAEGFEGDPDSARHRGTVNGWKVAGLPWVQG